MTDNNQPCLLLPLPFSYSQNTIALHQPQFHNSTDSFLVDAIITPLLSAPRTPQQRQMPFSTANNLPHPQMEMTRPLDFCLTFLEACHQTPILLTDNCPPQAVTTIFSAKQT
jgi:hypothetical protein